LDRAFGGVHILSPYQGKTSSDWYKGTANAIFQNLHFIKQFSPEYVLVLSGDHIYKMDYSRMINYHAFKEADCTIAAINVPREEASRFGILNTDEDGLIYQFEEKPANPKSTLASMGIYVFTAEKLYKYLEEDNLKTDSQNDFGKNVLPSMLAAGERMLAYEFEGYWKDVGTIQSLYDANMDLLGDTPRFDVADMNWKIQSRSPLSPPQYLGAESKVNNSIILSGSEIYGTVENSILSSNVKVKKGAVVRNSIIMSDVTVAENAVVEYAVIDENAQIGKRAKIGEPAAAQKGIAVVGRDVKVGGGVVVKGGAMVENDLTKEGE